MNYTPQTGPLVMYSDSGQVAFNNTWTPVPSPTFNPPTAQGYEMRIQLTASAQDGSGAFAPFNVDNLSLEGT